jgi:hypothetical protein
MRRRTYLIPLGVLALFVAGTGTSLAHWSTHGTGTGQARTATLNAPDVTVTLKPAGIVVNWDKARISGGGPHATGYYVIRIKGNGTTSAACGTSPSAPVDNTRCTDNPPTAGNYRYRVTAVYGGWTATSATTDKVIIAATGQATIEAAEPGTAPAPGKPAPPQPSAPQATTTEPTTPAAPAPVEPPAPPAPQEPLTPSPEPATPAP